MGQQKDELEIESYTPHDTGALEIESYVPLKPEPIHAQGFTMPETVRVTSPGQHDIELPPAPPPEATAQGPIQPLPLVSTRPEDMLQAPAGPIKPPRSALTVSRTGEGPSEQRYTRSDAAAELTGIPQMERGAVNLAIQSFTPPPPGKPEPYENFSDVPSHGTVTDKQAAAVSDMVEGFFKFSTPFVGAAAVRAPAEVAYGVFKAVVASKLGEKAAEELGATKEGQRLVGNIAALVTGSKAANDVIDTITADTARLVKKQAQALTLAGQLSGSGFSTGDVPGYRAPNFGELGVPDNPAYAETTVPRRPQPEAEPATSSQELTRKPTETRPESPESPESGSSGRAQPAPAAPALEPSTQEARNAQARAEAETQPPAYRDLAAVEQGRALERRVRAGVSPTGEERRQPELAIDHVDVTPAETEEHKFSSTQVDLPNVSADLIRSASKMIADEDLAPAGREEHPHVTVKYGLHTDDVEKVKEVLKDEPPIRVTLGKTSVFADSGDGDVVKADVDSPDLHRLNAKIADALEHTDTHPDYSPHVTLGYTKPGKGEKYAGRPTVQGHKVTIDSLTFSSKDGKIYEIPLTGPKTLSIPAPPAGRPGSAFVKLTDEQLRTVVDKGGMAAPAVRLELDRRSGGIGPEEYAQRLERLSGGARSALKEDSAPVQEIDWHRVKPRAVTLSKSYTINSNGNRFQTVLVTDREGRKHRYDIKVREGRDGTILSNFDAKQQALQQYKADVQSGKIVHAEIQPGGTETSGSRGAQPPRERAVPRRVREAGASRRPIIDRYDKVAIDGLVAEAQAGGFNGDAIDIEQQLRDRFQLLEDIDRATATDNPLTPHRQLLRIAASLEAIPFERGGHWQNLKGDRFEEGYTYRAGGDPIYTTITQVAGERATRAEVLTAIRGRLQSATLTTKQASIADAAERVAQAIVDGKLAIGTVKIQGPMLPPDAGVDTVALVQRLKDGLGEQWWTTIGSVPLIDDAREAGDEGDVSFNPDEFEPQPVVDRLDTGEEQPRLPEAGVVRDQNVETPAFEALFSLSSEAADVTGAQDSLFGSGPTERSAEPQEAAPATEERNLNARHTLLIDDVRTPAGALKADAANSRADSSVWFYQGDVQGLGFTANARLNGELDSRAPQAKETLREIKAAQGDGWRLVNMRAGSYGTVWTLQKGKEILTRAGTRALIAGTHAAPMVERSESGFDSLVRTQIAYATKFADWLKTLPESTLKSASALGAKMSTTGIGQWAKIVDDNGGKRIWFLKDGERDVSEAAATQEELIHKIIALAQEGADEAAKEAWQRSYGAEATAKERAAANESLYDVLHADEKRSGRDALIEKIVAASRAPDPDIRETKEHKGTDGKWYGALGFPIGVNSTGEMRSTGFARLTRDGATVGTRYPTRDALLEAHKQHEDKKAEEFREHLRTESDERLQSQASYWLKTAMQPGLAGHDAFMERLREGDVNPHDLKEAFQQTLDDRAKLTAQLSAMTKADLLKRFGRMGAERWKNDKKAAIVDAAYRDLVQDFVLADSLAYNPMAKGGFEAAVRAQVENATEETIADYAKRVSEQRAAYKKRVEGYVKAIKNPETLDEFDTFVSAHKQGEAGLTPEQRVTYDELRAKAGRAKREVEQSQRATVTAASGKVGAAIIETKHTRDGYDLFVVQLEQRVEREDYNRINEAAKKLGGWYSSYRKDGAVPGFQFKTREAAEAFTKFVTQGDTEAVKEAATERRATKREAKKNAAAERLADMADRLEEAAEESLGADRLTNTARRAGMAESADARARAEIAMARTLRNLAEAIESGQATHLDGIGTKVQVETLNKLAEQAKWDRLREQYPEYRDFEQHKDRRVEAADIEQVRYPQILADRDELVRAIGAFPNTRVATRLKALLRRMTTGVPKMEVPRDVAAEAVAKDEELGSRGVLRWSWAARLTDIRRLETAGIPDLPTLRAALREFIEYRGAKPAEDKVKKLERELAGNKGVGVDFFPTPEDLAIRMAEALDLQKGMTVLEPSAGNGNLADAVMQVQPEAAVEAVEVSSTLRDILEAKGYTLVGRDFADFAPEKQYDRVIMNPPFSDGQDADHVRRAYELLKPGGRLVAITGEGIFFREDKKARSFREWFTSVRGQSEKLEGAFTDRREVKTTSVNSRLLVIDKPAAAEKAKPKDEGGTTLEMAIIPGARQFAEYVVEPAVRKAAAGLSHDVKLAQRIFAPATISPEAIKASGTMRAHFAAKDQLIGRLHKNHATIAAMMDGWSHDQSLAFWDVMQGRAAPSTLPPDIRQIADAFRDILNFWTKQVRDRDLIRRYLDHYWPQEWKRADTVIARIMGRRPLAGRESFRKRRTIPSTREGVEDYGLEPVTWNPARQLERKVAEMARSVMAYDIRRDLTKQGFRKFAAAPKKAPAGWVQDKDRGVVYGPQTFTTASGEEARIPFGKLVVGHYYLQPDVARLLENHLTPGLWGQSVLFDAYRVLGNLSTQVLLGWSSFHLWMTGLESIVSKQSVAAELLARGDVVRAAKMQRWVGPHGLVRDLYRGYQAVKTFYADVADANDVSGIIGQIVNAGGGFNWTEFEHTNAPEKFMTDLRSLFGALKRMDVGEVAKATAKGVLHGPLAAIELPTHLIMTHWVPYLKASAFLDLAEAELARLPHNASLEEKRIVLGRAWDTIDDRLGQLRYDNLFWNRTFQQVLTGSFLSVGWNLGSLRAGMMAVPAQIGTVRRKLAGGGPPPRGPRSRQFEGPRPEGEPLRTDLEPLVHRRMVWLFMGALIVALLGALRQYLMTGKPPEGMKDLYAPRNGKVDDNGREERDVLISYAKDYYDWLHHPTSTLGHKLKPFLTMLYETYANEDFFGNALRDPHDPWYEQTADVLTHWLARERPIAWTNAEKRAGPNATAAQKLAEWGKLQAEPFTPASAEVERGAAENYLRSVNPPTPHTEASAEQMQARLKLRSALRAKEPGAIAEAMKEGVLSKRSVQHTRKTVADTSLQRSFTAAPIGDALEAYELATPNERQQLRVRLVKKYQSALKTLPATQRSGVIQRYREALTLPLATR